MKQKKTAYKVASKIRQNVRNNQNQEREYDKGLDKIFTAYKRARDKSVEFGDFLYDLRELVGADGKKVAKYGAINNKRDFLDHFTTREGNLKNLRKALTTGTTKYTITVVGDVIQDFLSTNNIFIQSFVNNALKEKYPAFAGKMGSSYIHVNSVDFIGNIPESIRETIRYNEDYNIFVNFDSAKPHPIVRQMIEDGAINSPNIRQLQFAWGEKLYVTYVDIRNGYTLSLPVDYRNTYNEWESSQFVKKQNGEVTFLYAKGKENYIRNKDEFTGETRIHIKPTEFMQTDVEFKGFKLKQALVTFEIPNKILYDMKFSDSNTVENVGIAEVDANWLTLDTFYNIELVANAYPAFSGNVKKDLNNLQKTLPLLQIILRIAKIIRSITKTLKPYLTASKKLGVTVVKTLVKELVYLRGVFLNNDGGAIATLGGEIRDLEEILANIYMKDSHLAAILKWIGSVENVAKFTEALELTVKVFVDKGYGTLEPQLISVISELFGLFNRYETIEISSAQLQFNFNQIGQSIRDIGDEIMVYEQQDRDNGDVRTGAMLLQEINTIIAKSYEFIDTVNDLITYQKEIIGEAGITIREKLRRCLVGALFEKLQKDLNRMIGNIHVDMRGIGGIEERRNGRLYFNERFKPAANMLTQIGTLLTNIDAFNKNVPADIKEIHAVTTDAALRDNDNAYIMALVEAEPGYFKDYIKASRAEQTNARIQAATERTEAANKQRLERNNIGIELNLPEQKFNPFVKSMSPDTIVIDKKALSKSPEPKATKAGGATMMTRGRTRISENENKIVKVDGVSDTVANHIAKLLVLKQGLKEGDDWTDILTHQFNNEQFLSYADLMNRLETQLKT